MQKQHELEQRFQNATLGDRASNLTYSELQDLCHLMLEERKANFVPTDLEIKALKEQVELLEKQNAAMREALESIKSGCPSSSTTRIIAWMQSRAALAISTTAGHNYKSPEEVAAIVADNKRMSDHINRISIDGAAHTKALKMARELLSQRFTLDVNLEWVQKQEALLATINNLLK